MTIKPVIIIINRDFVNHPFVTGALKFWETILKGALCGEGITKVARASNRKFILAVTLYHSDS